MSPFPYDIFTYWFFSFSFVFFVHFRFVLIEVCVYVPLELLYPGCSNSSAVNINNNSFFGIHIRFNFGSECVWDIGLRKRTHMKFYRNSPQCMVLNAFNWKRMIHILLMWCKSCSTKIESVSFSANAMHVWKQHNCVPLSNDQKFW